MAGVGRGRFQTNKTSEYRSGSPQPPLHRIPTAINHQLPCIPTTQTTNFLLYLQYCLHHLGQLLAQEARVRLGHLDEQLQALLQGQESEVRASCITAASCIPRCYAPLIQRQITVQS